MSEEKMLTILDILLKILQVLTFGLVKSKKNSNKILFDKTLLDKDFMILSGKVSIECKDKGKQFLFQDLTFALIDTFRDICTTLIDVVLSSKDSNDAYLLKCALDVTHSKLDMLLAELVGMKGVPKKAWDIFKIFHNFGSDEMTRSYTYIVSQNTDFNSKLFAICMLLYYIASNAVENVGKKLMLINGGLDGLEYKGYVIGFDKKNHINSNHSINDEYCEELNEENVEKIINSFTSIKEMLHNKNEGENNE